MSSARLTHRKRHTPERVIAKLREAEALTPCSSSCDRRPNTRFRSSGVVEAHDGAGCREARRSDSSVAVRSQSGLPSTTKA